MLMQGKLHGAGVANEKQTKEQAQKGRKMSRAVKLKCSSFSSHLCTHRTTYHPAYHLRAKILDVGPSANAFAIGRSTQSAPMTQIHICGFIQRVQLPGNLDAMDLSGMPITY
jgi:hypothetical protein